MNKQIESFLQGENVTVPFDLIINGESYICSEILRLLPSKRLVVKAENNGKFYVIKLFANAKKGQRELKREQAGYQLAKKSDINLPQLQFVSNDMKEYCAIAYDFLEQAQPFSDDSVTVVHYAGKLFELVSALHNLGIYQDDFHLDNVLIVKGQLFLIDLASVKSELDDKSLSKQKSFENLAKLIVQFIPKQQQVLIEKLETYFKERVWLWNKTEQDRFTEYLHLAWKKRKGLYLKKCFRSCTMTAYNKNFRQQSAFRRSFIDDVGQDFISNIDALVDKGELLKGGNSATVVKVAYAGKQLVIKRYNMKSFWHLLKRCYRPSRAAVSWRNGNLLELMGVASPKALGFIEQRFGWLRKTAYLVCEYTDGQELYDVYQSRSPIDIELAQLKEIFGLLHSYKVSHGDLKASNLLLDKNGVISLIDLDAMHEHSDPKKLNKALNKDKKRFLKNWQAVEQKTKFEDLFP